MLSVPLDVGASFAYLLLFGVASYGIHGITSAMVRGRPGIAQVLRSFHAYAHDTVLVTHNAAFDMRFLQLKESDSGVVFDQPVLDTCCYRTWRILTRHLTPWGRLHSAWVSPW